MSTQSKAASAGAVDRARRAVDGLRMDWADRYGEVVCEVEVGLAQPPDAEALQLGGYVLVPAQRQAILEAIRIVSSGQPIVCGIEALTERETVDAWVIPIGPSLDILARPEGSLANQWIVGDPPARRLIRRADWWALELADRTVGWARAADCSLVSESGQIQDLEAWRSLWLGSWQEPPFMAWREAGEAWLGAPYLWGGNSPEGIDCSGLTQRIYRSVAGIGLPKHSRDQVREGERISRKDLRPGDMVFLSHRQRRLSHVGVVVEAEPPLVLNASFDANAVLFEALDAMLERYQWRGARRFDRFPPARESQVPPRRPERGRPERGRPDPKAAEPPGTVPDPSLPGMLAAPQPDPARLAASSQAWARLRARSSDCLHVVGLASTEGAAICRLLASLGVRDLVVHDIEAPESIAQAFMQTHVGLPRAAREALWRELESLPMQRRLGRRYLEGIGSADAVFAPQAWYLYPANMPKLAAIKASGRDFIGLMELYFELSPAPIMAFTGSNGKSTASRLAESIMRLSPSAGQTYYAGNERRSVQVLDRLERMRPEDWLILEVSNRHLKEIAPRPAIGVITNVLPNHLDEHGGDFEAYAATKARLLGKQEPGDRAILNFDNETTRAMADSLTGDVYFFSRLGAVDRGAWIGEDGRIKLRHGPNAEIVDAGPIRAARIPGAHNQENILAASLAAWLAGATPEAISRGIRMFRGLRHRLQFVWAARGVHYYDDLNSTSPQATLAALRALDGPLTLIAGGDDKGLDYRDLAEEICRRAKGLVVLPGKGGERLIEAVERARSDQGQGPVLRRFEALPEALASVVETAERGDSILLSPACPYFFRMHYMDASRRELGFKALLRELTSVSGDEDPQEEVG